MCKWKYLVAILLAAGAGSCTADFGSMLSEPDLEAMRQASRAYAAAWLTNDSDRVMATFVEQPVLSPSGLPFIEGQADARAFWWPEGSPPTRVTRFDFNELEASGSGDVGYVRGTYTLVFDYDQQTYTNRGKFIQILKRVDRTNWRISHYFWNDLPPRGGQ